MMVLICLAQAAPTASTVFLLTLLFIFLTAILTTFLTKRTRDKCLKFFNGYHMTLERARGRTIWGRLKVFSSGVEVIYDHPYIDLRGRRKTSFLIYQGELEQQVIALLRYHDELDPLAQRKRLRQIRKTFNPGLLRRLWRAMRNFVNTLRDAFNAAIGTVITTYQRTNPASMVIGSQAGAVTTIGQTLLGKFANAYEPLLEQYIGQPVILEVADPLDPNNASVEFPGYLADYTQHYIAVFNVEHRTAEQITLALPDVAEGPAMTPFPPPPPPGAPYPALPAPLAQEHGISVYLDAVRFRVFNGRHESLVVRRLERDGFEPLELGMIIPPRGQLDLPARDARAGRLIIEVVQLLDVVAPRRLASIRHAGELIERKGLIGGLAIDQLPLVSKLFSNPGDES